MSSTTTIKIASDLRDRLNALKIHPRETYSEVIGRLVENSVDDEPLSNETIKAIEASLEDLKAGRIFTLDEVMAEISEE